MALPESLAGLAAMGGLRPEVYPLLLSPEPMAPYHRHQVRLLMVHQTLLHALARLVVQDDQVEEMPLLMVQAQPVKPSCAG